MTNPTAGDIRTWAREQGLTVADRGRLPVDVLAAYDKAHSARTAKTTTSPTTKKKPASPTTEMTGARSTPKQGSATKHVRQPAGKAEDVPAAAPGTAVALERRVSELEKQVLSLTERLDATVVALTKRARSFSLSKRR